MDADGQLDGGRDPGGDFDLVFGPRIADYHTVGVGGAGAVQGARCVGIVGVGEGLVRAG